MHRRRKVAEAIFGSAAADALGADPKWTEQWTDHMQQLKSLLAAMAETKRAADTAYLEEGADKDERKKEPTQATDAAGDVSMATATDFEEECVAADIITEEKRKFEALFEAASKRRKRV